MELFAVCKFYLELQGRGPNNINWKETIPPIEACKHLETKLFTQIILKTKLKNYFLAYT